MHETDIATQPSNTAALKAAHEEFLFPCLKPIYREPLALVEANGVTVVDADGETYVDFFAGILTTSVGHCHPEVVDRVRNFRAAVLGTAGTGHRAGNKNISVDL